MTTITDEQLHLHADRVKGKVVVITGAANGFGKETALRFAKFGAKVVIGDLDVDGAEHVTATIRSRGGQSVAQRCDVMNWDDQISLFELAESRYGSVDVVVPNAGVTELGSFTTPRLIAGKLIQPSFKTLKINLVGVMYTAHIGLYYMQKRMTKGDLKSIIFLGSMASWEPIPGGPLYTAAKHGVLGFMRSIYPSCHSQGIRVATIHPWFANTALVPTIVKVFLAGIPLTPIERVAGAIVCAATDPHMETSGCTWLLPDGGYVFRLEREQLKEGVYRIIDARVKAAVMGIRGIKYAFVTIRDLGIIFRRSIMLAVLVCAAAMYLYSKGAKV